MITESAFPVEPWVVRETRLDLDLLAQSESVFALANGHIGLRGNLDEGEPHGLPGTYLNSFYEVRPLPYAEAGYGYPEAGQTIVNVTNGKIIRLLVDDQPFDVRYGTLERHERVLDLRAGTLTRRLEWTSPSGSRVRVRSTRLVSFTQRAVAGVEYVVEAVDGQVRLVAQSELVANEALPRQSGDPRVAAALETPLHAVDAVVEGDQAVLVHQTRMSGLTMAAGMAHVVSADADVRVRTQAHDDLARATIVVALSPGQSLRIVKLLAYGWSSLRSWPAVRDQVAAALSGALATGFEGLLEEQRAYLDDFWDAADVEVTGDDEVQQAVRFALFHVLQSGARAEQRAIAAKGLTGPGYDGHTFWDTEGFVLPVLTYTQPAAAAAALRWRHSTIDLARQRAATLGLQGAAFPWRTIRGQECSAYWPAGTAGMHVTADIASAVGLYTTVTGDLSLEREGGGLELLVDAARLWMSVGNFDRDGGWHVAGVTGPDEYTALVDDNVFTNLVAANALRCAVRAVERSRQLAETYGVPEAETDAWRRAADSVVMPYDEVLGVHEQCAGFTRLPEFDFEGHRDDYPLLLHVPYFELYRRQVVKQADLEMALFWFGDRFSREDKARDIDYYERRTVRDSSLSACVQAVVLAEAGHVDLAYDMTYEAALVDLHDLHQNTRDGLHIASLAGTWIALVAGFGGLREHDDKLSFDPRLPSRLARLAFGVRWRDWRVDVDVRRDGATYQLRDGSHGKLTFRHGDEELTLGAGESVTVPLRPREPLLPPPASPPGREPPRRSA